MSSGVSPLLVIVLVFVFLANLLPLLIYLEYKRRLYRKLQQRRNSDEQVQKAPEIFVDDDEQEEVPKAISSSPTEDDVEKGSSAEQAARSFVAKQEQMMEAARSRWNNRNKGYGVLGSGPPSDY